MSEVKSAGEE